MILYKFFLHSNFWIRTCYKYSSSVYCPRVPGFELNVPRELFYYLSLDIYALLMVTLLVRHIPPAKIILVHPKCKMNLFIFPILRIMKLSLLIFISCISSLLLSLIVLVNVFTYPTGDKGSFIFSAIAIVAAIAIWKTWNFYSPTMKISCIATISFSPTVPLTHIYI